ncbi:MAG: hypothetical protein WBW02_22820, partial [Candidatus Sulfotelmatobacter sp.]
IRRPDRNHRRLLGAVAVPPILPRVNDFRKTNGTAGGTVEDAALAATREGHDFRRALRGGKDLGFSPRCP